MLFFMDLTMVSLRHEAAICENPICSVSKIYSIYQHFFNVREVEN